MYFINRDTFYLIKITEEYKKKKDKKFTVEKKNSCEFVLTQK